MLIKRIVKLTIVFMMLITLIARANAPGPAQAAGGFADPAFLQVWQRTDAPIAAHKVSRSYYWGPAPGYSTMEDFTDAPGGKRLVQYFDKSRMEINDPNGDKSSKFYVTNGLLATELLTGKMQLGNKGFIDLGAPSIALASDPDDPKAPTYATFGHLLTYAAVGVGSFVNQSISGEDYGPITTDIKLNGYAVKYVYTEPTTGYSIPNVFWDYLNTSGPVLVNGQQVTARLSDPYFYATGYPISNAYWASVKIAGKPNTAVLIQAYQRRILTYVPSAPDGYKVQMGNIGQHYFQWRYGSDPAHPIDFLTRCGATLNNSGGESSSAFSRLWAQNVRLHPQLGCPLPVIGDPAGDLRDNLSMQLFEHGAMVNVITSTTQGQSQTVKRVFALYDDGTVQQFDDTFVDGSSEPTLNPPAGLYAPHYGFGKVWRENTDVQQKLGWATARERKLLLGEYRYTEHGLLIQKNPDLTHVYAMYGKADLQYTGWQFVDVGAPSARQCNSLPAGFTSTSFGKLWTANTIVQQQLDCPADPNGSDAVQADVYIQHFEHGNMVYIYHINHPTPMSTSSANDYALLKDGTLLTSISFYDPNAKPNNDAPPAGLYAPGDKFDQYWRSNPTVQQELGWATAPQQAVSKDDSYFFISGVMIRDGGKLYCLYSFNFYYFIYSEFWASYDEPH